MTERKTVIVRLTPEQIAAADGAAVAQHDKSVADGRKDRVVNKTNYSGDAGTRKHKIGARGEMAVAVHLGRLKWNPSGTLDTFGSVPDVNGYDVRTRASFKFGFPVRPSDRHPERILVCCDLPDLDDNIVLIQGWTTIGEAKTHPEWLLAPGGGSAAWFIPPESLNDISTLPKDDHE